MGPSTVTPSGTSMQSTSSAVAPFTSAKGLPRRRACFPCTSKKKGYRHANMSFTDDLQVSRDFRVCRVLKRNEALKFLYVGHRMNQILCTRQVLHSCPGCAESLPGAVLLVVSGRPAGCQQTPVEQQIRSEHMPYSSEPLKQQLP
jgi:hypothetical protein